jgi:outer membrane protein
MFKLTNQNSLSLRNTLRNNRHFKIRQFLPTKAFLLISVGFIQIFTWVEPSLAQSPVPKDSGANNSQTVELSLSNIVQLVIQNNRTVKNNFLDRIIEKQQLVEAQSKFKPTLTPNFSVSVNEDLSSSPDFDSAVTASSDSLIAEDDTTTSFDDSTAENNTSISSDGFDGSGSNFEHSLQIGANLRTPLGTNITLTADPLADFEILGLEIRQPLLRGAGTKVNQASIKSASLSNTRQVFQLKQSLSDQITESIKAYRTLIQAQEEVKIRQKSLESRRRDLQVQITLVKAGRRARADLVQLEASLAGAEEQLLGARNSLSQANSDLLGFIDTDRNLKIAVPIENIQALTKENFSLPVENNQQDLLPRAYAQRPDYLQAQLDTKIARFDLIEPQDNRRWQLDAVSNFNLGDSSQAIASLELTRTFEDQSLNTAFQNARIQFLQRQNDLQDLREAVRIEVSQQVTNVNSNLAKIEKARRAKELAEERLEIVKKLYLRGRGGVDIFEVTSQQDEVVEAQNTELNAIVDYLNARTDLEQSLGTTLNTWQEFINQVDYISE